MAGLILKSGINKMSKITIIVSEFPNIMVVE